jgi:filamentous hemagglutinin
MNKLCYRIVFNKTRGLCMAVAETTRTRTKAPGQGVVNGSTRGVMPVPALRRLALLIGMGLGGMTLADGTSAQIIADPNAPGKLRPTVLETANGVVQVNIQTPSAAGVSRNVYSQFDVPKSGVVLNNSRTDVQSQLGGWVQGNPWLGKGTARVILNEVNSSNPSRLQGYIEVAGDRAEMIVANPAGISVSGGGFINVSRATLTTGSPILEDGRLRGYSVQRGQIVFGEGGLDASKTDYTALIARSVEVNAGLWAQRLNVITGINEVEEAALASVTHAGQGGGAPPLFAVDVAQLGGMYANQIYMVGTEAGVGVRNAGEIGAGAGDLIVTSGGRLENSGTLSASQGLEASAASVANRGNIQAGDKLLVTADNLANAGQIKSASEALIKVQGEIDNGSGRIEAARVDLTSATFRNAQGTVLQTGTSGLSLKTEQFSNASGTLGPQGAAGAGGDTVGTGDSAGTDGGVLAPVGAGATPGAGQQVPDHPNTGAPDLSGSQPVLADGRVEAETLDNASGLIASNGRMALDTGTFENHGGAAYLGSLSVSGSFFDNSGGMLTVLDAFKPKIDRFVNDHGKLLMGAAFDGGFGSFSNRHGLLQATQLTVDVARNLDNSGGTLRHLGSTAAEINVGGELALGHGLLDIASDLALRATSVSGSGSSLNVTGHLTVEGGVTSSVQGKWIAGGDVSLRTSALDNNGGTIVAAGTLNAKSGDLNNAGGMIAAADAAIKVEGAVDNGGGSIQVTRSLSLDVAGNLLNHAGNIEALRSDSTISVKGASIDNRAGRIANTGIGKTLLDAAKVSNSGLIGGNGVVEIIAQTLTNEAAGSIRSVENMELAVRDSLYNAGRIDAGESVRLVQGGAQLRNSGNLVAVGDIEIAVGAIDNTTGTIATAAGHGSRLSLQATTLRNNDGVIDVDGQSRIEIGGSVDNERGRIRSGGDLTFDAKENIENRGGNIETLGGMQVHGGQIANHGGTIAAAGGQSSSIEAERGIDNNGLIGANGQLALKAQTLNNGDGGTVSVTGDLELGVRGALVNSGGKISTAGILNFNQEEAALVNSGAITSASDAVLNLDLIDNDGGTIGTLQGANVDLRANALSNRGGRVMSGADATVLVKGDIDSAAGVLQAAGSIDIDAGSALRNQGGVIESLGAHGTLGVHAATIDNTSGRIVNVGDADASVSATGHIENSGLIASNGRMALAADTVNSTGTVSSTSEINLAVSSNINNSGTISAATGLQTRQGDAVLRNSGTIVSGGALDMTVKTVDNTGGRIATAQGAKADVLLTAQSIVNKSGVVMTERDAILVTEDGVDNRSGLVQAQGDLRISAGGLVDVSGGSIESLSAGSTLELRAGAVVNELGRIVNVGDGDTLVRAASTLVNNGQIAGSGKLAVEAQSVANMSQGGIAADSLVLQAHTLLDNAGTISSGAALTIDEDQATLSNRGTIVVDGDIAIRTAAIDNSGGTLATAEGSGANVTLQANSLSNRDGRIITERALTVAVGGALDNTRGLLQGVDAVRTTAGGNVTNDGGVIEATAAHATLVLQANALLNGTGRVVNVGDGVTTIAAAESLENSGLVADNGMMALSADRLVNKTGGTVASAGAMTATIGTRLDNAGTVQGGDALRIAAQAADVKNSGLIAADGTLTLASAIFNNDGGQLATVKGSGGNLALDAAAISNRGGAILSDKDAQVNSTSGFDNTLGTLQAANSLQINVGGAAGNDGGVIETMASSADLNLHAGALDNGNGRIVNVGAGATTLTVDGKLVSRGLIAGNGDLNLTVAELENQAGASIAASKDLEITATHAISNGGVVSTKEALVISAAGAAVRNSGHMVSGAGATIDTAAFDNSGGQLGTVAGRGGDIVLRASEIVNVGGKVVADGGAQIVAGVGLDNRQGELRANTAVNIDAAGMLANRDGVIEAAGPAATLHLRADSIDNTAGRVANVGSGAMVVAATNAIVNSGTIAGNGALVIAAQTLQSTNSGTIGALGALELTVRQQLTNAGVITSGQTLRFDQASAGFINSGRIGAGGAIDITAANVRNDGGQIYTVDNLGAVINLRAGTLDNIAGTISADGQLRVNADGNLINDSGTLHGGTGTVLDVSSALANGSGTIESAAGDLAIAAQFVDTSGRIVNAGTGVTTIDSATGIVNAGTITGKGAIDLSAKTLQNSGNGTVSTGTGLDLAISERLTNAGAITSEGTIRFDHASATLSNTGRIGAGGSIDIIAAEVSNSNGGQVYTVNQSGAAITLDIGRLENTGGTFSADGLLNVEVDSSVANSAGVLRGGTGAALRVGGALDNGSGAVEASSGSLTVQSQSIDNGGRIVNAGTGQTTVDSREGIVNSGTIAGNGALDLHASALQNEAGAQLASGHALLLEVDQQLRNAGTISSGSTLGVDGVGASFANSGEITAAGSMHLATAIFDNSGGRISTVRGSGTDITVVGTTLSNHGGAILADRNATFLINGSADNSHGTLQAGNSLALTSSGTISNAGGVVEALGAHSSLVLDGVSIDNGTGKISNAGNGDTNILSQTGIGNSGTIAGMGNVLLSGQTLLNQAGATVASGNNLALAFNSKLDNRGKINSAGTLTFNQAGATFLNSGEVYSGGHALINASVVNNDGGRLGTASGSGADLTLTSQELSNSNGRIATDRDLVIDTHAVTTLGKLFGGRDLSVAMDGNYVQSGGVQQLRSNRNLSLSVSGNITNTATMEAAGVLTLSGQQIVNAAGASIEGMDVILKARGDLTNAGEINGANTLDISAANVSNSAGIVGGNVSVATGNLGNNGSSALIGATNALSLGVAGTLNNTGGATLYSSGNMTIGKPGGGSTVAVNNISSTIEAGGNLELNANTLSNVRENVQIVQVKTVDETVHMKMPDWYHFGDNNNYYDKTSSNYRAHEVYFVSPSDILEDQVFVTPDGQTIHRAVIRTHANDSAFLVEASGQFGHYGGQSRLTPSDGTRVIYYLERAENIANPDQGAPAANAIVLAGSVTNWSSTIDFSNQYGSCSSNCIRLITQPGYDDPRTTIIRTTQQMLAAERDKLEATRDAHHVVLEDRLAPGAGAVAQILSGGDMRLTVSTLLENRFSDIKAKGSLTLDGDADKPTFGGTLYRTHMFDGTWTTKGGETTRYQNPSISEKIGSLTGIIEGNQGVYITGRSFSLIDVTAGTVGNIRDAVNVIGSGASGANSAGAQVGATTGTGGTVGSQIPLNTNGSETGLASAAAATGFNSANASSSAAASGLANHTRTGGNATGSGYANKPVVATDVSTSGTANSTVTKGAANKSSADNTERLASTATVSGNNTSQGDLMTAGGTAAARQASSVQGAALAGVTKVTPSGLFIRNPDAASNYLFETRPQFANQRQWASSDYLLKQLAFDPATTQKRLGDGFYEQRLVREQLAELTGHVSYSGASDDSIYSQLLTNAVSAAKEFGLRPGIALSAEQVKHLTSDIAWLESQTVMLPDGSTETVLVPKVYLAHVGERALQPGGALMIGNGVTINTTEDIFNSGGVIDGGNGRTLLVAGQDILNRGGTIKGSSVVLAADRDIRNESLAVTQTYDFQQNGGSHTSLSNEATIKTAGSLDIVAGRNLSDLAGKITAGSAVLTAGNNIDFDTIRTGSTYQSQIGGYAEKNSSVTHQLSQTSTTGDLKIAAKGDLNLTGTQVSIGTGGSGDGQLLAGRNVNIAAVTNEASTSLQNDPGSKNYDKRIYENQTVIGGRGRRRRNPAGRRRDT